jgi:hypothetical protein
MEEIPDTSLNSGCTNIYRVDERHREREREHTATYIIMNALHYYVVVGLKLFCCAAVSRTTREASDQQGPRQPRLFSTAPKLPALPMSTSQTQLFLQSSLAQPAVVSLDLKSTAADCSLPLVSGYHYCRDRIK